MNKVSTIYLVVYKHKLQVMIMWQVYMLFCSTYFTWFKTMLCYT